jgi:hypothetical protein
MCVGLKKTEKATKVQKGCRAIDREKTQELDVTAALVENQILNFRENLYSFE